MHYGRKGGRREARQKGPFLALDSFEEETFLVVPLADASNLPHVLCRTEIVISRLIPSALSLELLWGGRQERLNRGATKEGAVRTGIRSQGGKRAD